MACSCTRAWFPGGLAEGFSRSDVFATTADNSGTSLLVEGMMGSSLDCTYPDVGKVTRRRETLKQEPSQAGHTPLFTGFIHISPVPSSISEWHWYEECSQAQKYWIMCECHKDTDFSLARAAYSKTGKTNPFDPVGTFRPAQRQSQENTRFPLSQGAFQD